LIEFKHFTKSFGARTVLYDLNLTIEEGNVVFVLGRSGSGKSVLLKNLVGLMRPTEGEIWVDGVRVDTLSEEQYLPVRRKCGMVFQQPALLDSLSVFENIAFGLRRMERLEEDELRERVRECLKAVHLNGIEDKMPYEISYGMQKRVSLARTLALRPKILLFDEPTTGLDPITTQSINKLIQTLSEAMKTTSLVVSHDMGCALDIADRVIVLDNAKVVADGTPDELLKSDHPLVKDFLAEVQPQ
jgi:phospholipid/cholesterol/gamma-HCH transport system ATP-binding protein